MKKILFGSDGSVDQEQVQVKVKDLDQVLVQVKDQDHVLVQVQDQDQDQDQDQVREVNSVPQVSGSASEE